MFIAAHCKCMQRGEHHMWQERLSGVASPTNPAGCNQIMKAKQIPKQIARVHTITLWMKRPCHLNTSGNDLTSSWKFSKTEEQLSVLHFQVFGHRTRLGCMACPAPSWEKIAYDCLLPGSLKLEV